MTDIFNQAREKNKRRDLRNNPSKAELRLWLRLRNR
jgi:very-short-patch-repair endonuclease